MSDELVKNIKNQTEVLFFNADICVRTCNLDFILCDMPIWKHVYHMLHSCDQWFISPFEFDKEPDFHEPNLNSLDIKSETVLSREQLINYLEYIETKTLTYINSLTDEKLYEIPKGCVSNRLGMIMSQFRHFYAHLGNINATTIIETNEWPRVVGYNGKPREKTTHYFE